MTSNEKPASVPEGKVVDYIDGKLRDDKPEERVRQALEKRLVNAMRYPRARLAVEQTIKIGASRKRVDIAIFTAGRGREQSDIWLIIECKAEKVSPGDRLEGVAQLKSYMAACVNATWGVWTNGKHREVWEKVRTSENLYEFVERVDFPGPDGAPVTSRKRQDLEKATGDNLIFAFRSAHNYIHTVDGFQKEKSFFELLKVIFCKIWDEKNIPRALSFYVSSEELRSADGQLACANRIRTIFDRVKTSFPQIFGHADELELNPRSLVRIVSELQNFSLLASDVDIKGKAYEEVVGSNLKGDRGQFFTPRNIMRMAVDLLDVTDEDRTLDPACGTGGFLVTAMLSVVDDLRRKFVEAVGSPAEAWGVDNQRQFDERVRHLVGANFFGLDISPELVRASKMNMVMNNDGAGNLLQADTLLPPYRWTDEFRSHFAAALNKGVPDVDQLISASDLTDATKLNHFDVVVTNPPFGSKIVIRDTEVLEQYDLGHIWESTDEGWKKTTRLQSGVPPEQLFLERCIQFLKPGGRMAIVLPDSILGSPGLEYIRVWLLSQAEVLASVDLNQDAFQPNVGVQTSVLVIRKHDPLDHDRRPTEAIFMAIVDRVGHDKRGHTTYVRDDYGDEVIHQVESQYFDDNGVLQSEMRNEKIVDDQTPLVAPLFAEWREIQGVEW
jgi:type I restriction enzyme M protein